MLRIATLFPAQAMHERIWLLILMLTDERFEL